MLAKLTSKNQITLPKAVVSKFPGTEYFAVREVDGEIILHYMEHAEAIKQPRTRARLPQCRDPHDEMFIRLAYAAKAGAIVTGDDDLLALAPESLIPILTPAAFRALP